MSPRSRLSQLLRRATLRPAHARLPMASGQSLESKTESNVRVPEPGREPNARRLRIADYRFQNQVRELKTPDSTGESSGESTQAWGREPTGEWGRESGREPSGESTGESTGAWGGASSGACTGALGRESTGASTPGCTGASSGESSGASTLRSTQAVPLKPARLISR